MNKERSKTHYRNVFKSDHLGKADLEEMIEDGKKLIFTIKEIKQYEYVSGDKNSGVMVAGRRISANIATFTDSKMKPFVVNSSNSKIVAEFYGSRFVCDWTTEITVELYVNKDAKLKGEKVGGIGIRPTQPVIVKPKLIPSSKQWEKAKKAALAGEADFESLNKHYDITQANFEILIDPKQD